VGTYLDHAATTPLRPSVVALLTQSLLTQGNASSVHSFGQKARQVVEQAREEIAAAVVADRNEVIFTSGGTESDNLAIQGLYSNRNRQTGASRPIIISAATEHHAVLEPIEWLVANRGAQVHWLQTDINGLISLTDLEKFLTQNAGAVALISLMWVNNETGVIQDIPAISRLAARFEVPVHSDAVAALGHIPIDFAASGLAAMSITGHKLGGPVGHGALLVSRKTKLDPIFHGGGHERGMRPGTLDPAGSSALALAVKSAVAELPADVETWLALNQRLVKGVVRAVPQAHVVASELPLVTQRVPNIVNLIFPGCSGDSLLFLLDARGVAVSNGSACTAGVTSASHVLLAMGYSQRDASSCVRVSLGHTSTADDIDAFLHFVAEAFERARAAGFTA
jgi:cysteine desulfurase